MTHVTFLPLLFLQLYFIILEILHYFAGSVLSYLAALARTMKQEKVLLIYARLRDFLYLLNQLCYDLSKLIWQLAVTQLALNCIVNFPLFNRHYHFTYFPIKTHLTSGQNTHMHTCTKGGNRGEWPLGFSGIKLLKKAKICEKIDQKSQIFPNFG